MSLRNKVSTETERKQDMNSVRKLVQVNSGSGNSVFVSEGFFTK